jgi:hypothetical protein
MTGAVGTGPTGPTGIPGPTGPVGQAAVLALSATGTNQTFSNVPSVVKWLVVDGLQSTGNSGVSYEPTTGIFSNITVDTLPLLIEYDIVLNNTGTGASYINMFSNGVNYQYGIRYNAYNTFTNSFTILLPQDAQFSVYYNDLGTPILQNDSRIHVSLLKAGQMGATGTTGPTGVTGPTGYADRFVTATTTAVTLTPVVNGSVTVTVQPKLAYIPGNSVLVVNSTNSTSYFEGSVLTYGYETGVMTVNKITNVNGSFASSAV